MNDIKIIKLRQDCTLVGHVKRKLGAYVLTHASRIDRWGTTLGEDALNGPTADTLLVPMGRVTVPSRVVLLVVDCVAEKWEAHLG